MQTIRTPPGSTAPSIVPLFEARTHAFIITSYREPTFHFRWHFHPEVELVWIRQGAGLRYTGRAVEPFKDGDLVLLGGNLPHTWGSSPDQQGDAVWTVIQFEPALWGEAFWHLPELGEMRKLLHTAEQGVQFLGPQVQQIGDLMEALVKARSYSFEALAWFMDICRRLLATPSRALNSQPTSGVASRVDPRLQQVLTLVDKQSGEPLTQAGVAAGIKMNPAVFCHWFRNQTGRNFQRYLNEVRIARVCARLADSNDSITSVAMECGFNNLANFNRRFLEIKGITPRAFRVKARAICA